MSAYTTVQQRLPGSYDLGELSERKQQLVDEMSEFTKEGDRVNPTESHLRLAEELVRTDDRTRYVKIPFGNIVDRNQASDLKDEGCMDMMATAFDVLFRYTVNMLKLKRPRNWHTIKFTNPQFRARADCMIGTRNILKIMGYTKEVRGENNIQNGLAYPDPSVIDHNIIKLIAAELLIAKTEVKDGCNPNNLIFFKNVHLESPRNRYQESPREPDMYTSIPQQPVEPRPTSNSSYYNTHQSDSHNFSPSLLHHTSYHPPSQGFGQPSTMLPSSSQQYAYRPVTQTGFQPQPSSSSQQYGERHVPQTSFHAHPSSDQQYGYKPGDFQSQSSSNHQYRHQSGDLQSQHSSSQQYGHHSGDQISFQGNFRLSGMQTGYQSGSHSVWSSNFVEDQSMSIEDLEPTPINTSASKLDELRRRKANIKQILDQSSQNAENSTNYSGTLTSTPIQSSSASTPEVTQPTAAPQVTPKPAPRVKPRTKFFKVLPQEDDTKKLSESTFNEKAPNQELPPEKPQRPAVSIMMKCDVCGFPNDEKSMECIKCKNPKSERWIKITMSMNRSSSSLEPETPHYHGETPSVSHQSSVATPSDRVIKAPSDTQSKNQPFSSEVTAAASNAQYYDQLTAGAQYNNQPTAGAQYNNPPTAGAQYNNRPTAGGQYYDQPTAEAQYNNQPTAEAQYNNRPTTGGQYYDQPTAGAQYNNQPTAGAQYNNRPTAGGQYYDQPTAEAQYNNQPTAEAQYNNRPTTGGQYYDQPTAGAQYNNQPTAEAQYNNRSTAEAQYNNQPTAGGQYYDQPTAGAQYNNQPTAGAQYNNRPTAGGQYYEQPTATTQPVTKPPSKPIAKPRYDGHSSASGTSATTAAGAGASSSKGFVPPKQYSKEEKEKMRLEAEKAKARREMMEELQSHGNEGGGFQSYMARNNNYSQSNGTTERPTGSVLHGYGAKMIHPEDTQHYRSLANQGNFIIQEIKEGLRCGYKLEEIRVATELQHDFHKPCEFLSREWNNYIDRTVFLVNQLSEAEHRKRKMTGSIGRPNRREIVKYLIEEGGNCERAAQKCCNNRLKMIQELMKEIRLPQGDAVRALENNGLDVNKAIHAVYRDKINSNQLYQYMWGELEGGGIKQIQNNRIEEMITQKLHNDYYLQRLLMAEYKLPTTANCEVLIHLVRECKLTLGACIDVAKTNDDIDQAKNLLTQECPICCEAYTRNEMVNMINCDHAVCHDCFVSHFSIMVTEKSIKHCNCPLCKEPDMTSETIDMDLYLQLFSGLIQAHMKKEEYDMFTQKINEHTMMKDPNFRWCIKCSTGFINEGGRKRIQCPNLTCGEMMCFLCKKPWEDQHETLSCDEFAAWKKDNDPELQAQGLAAYLNEEGIECPSCGFKYALAKGGCMHFRCNQCPAEFCSGCNNLFRKAEDCTKYESCRKKGLHAHHPRDCLFFLRDESVDDLQKLLKDNNVEFDTDPPQGQVDAQAAKDIEALQEEDAPVVAPAAVAPALKCHVMLQKESPNGPPIDEECGIAVESGHAGLCLRHYKEYLVFKINQSHIDPLPLYETGPLKAILGRDEEKVPDQQPEEGEPEYAERLRKYIKEKIPLEERAATKNF